MSVSLKESYDIAYDGSENAARMDLFIDTSADLAGLTHFDSIKLLQGSTVEDISTGDKYMMQTGGTWVLQPSAQYPNAYTKAQTDGLLSAHVCTCDTAGNVADKVATTSDDFVLREGTIISVYYTYTNTVTDNSTHPVTLNVNNTGTYRIYYANGVYVSNAQSRVFGYANRYIYYMFYNNRWVWLGWCSLENFNTMTQAEASQGTSTANRIITPKVLHDSILEITDHKAAVSFTPTPIVSLLNCTFTIPDSSRSLRFTVGKLNATQNYLQVYVNGVDKGYIIFDVSRNIDDWGE